jgi:hypothetical protein
MGFTLEWITAGGAKYFYSLHNLYVTPEGARDIYVYGNVFSAVFKQLQDEEGRPRRPTTFPEWIIHIACTT